MNHDWLQIHALLDDELSPEERAQVQERLKSCKVSQAEWVAVREVKAVLAEKCVQPASEDLWNQCAKRLDQLDRTKKAEFFVGRYAWAICGALLVVICGAAALNRFNGGGLHTGDLASASLIQPLSGPATQGVDDQRAWLQNNLGNSMPVQANRIMIIGGMVGSLNGHVVKRVDLRDDSGPLSIYMMEKTKGPDDVEQVDGHSQYSGGNFNHMNCITWEDHGDAYLLAGNRPVEGLCQVADELNAHR